MNEIITSKHLKERQEVTPFQKFMSAIGTVIQKIVNAKNAFREKVSERKVQYKRLHPFFKALYKYIKIALILIVIVLSFLFIHWRVNIHIERKAEELTQIAMDLYKEQLMAEEYEKENMLAQAIEASRQSEEAIFNRQVEALAKLAYGIRNFENKYGYDEDDYMRYFRCVTNRLEYGGYGDSLEEVINMPNQWVAYHRDNPVVTRYKEMAEKFLTAYNEETERPMDCSYRFTVFTEAGLFLSKEFNSNNPYSWYKD